MKYSSDNILTTHTGSLPRPNSLVQLMYAKEEGMVVDQNEIDKEVKCAVESIVARQIESGISVISDGEMSKPSYATYITERLTGFGGPSLSPQLSDILEFPNVASAYFNDPGVKRLNKNRPTCNAPVELKSLHDAEVDIKNFEDALAKHSTDQAFMTAASPGLVSMFLGNSYYSKEEDFLIAVAEAMQPEYEAIVAHGFLLQLDCPDLAMTRHREFSGASIEEFRRYAERHIEILNRSLVNIPEERVRVHICWGNYPGPHHRDVPLRDILDLIMKIDAQGIVFEAANSRHEHEWSVFKEVKIPDNKILIPGVVESMSNRIEHPELVAQRLERFAHVVGRERVIAGSDCGFGTFVGLALVEPEIAWAKLGSLVQGAEIASERLW